MDKNQNQLLISLQKELAQASPNEQTILNLSEQILQFLPKDQDILKCKLMAQILLLFQFLFYSLLKMDRYQDCQQILKEDLALQDLELSYYFALTLFKIQKYQLCLQFIEKIPEAQQQVHYGLLLVKAQALEKLKKFQDCYQVYFFILEKFPKAEETEEIIANLLNISYSMDSDQNKDLSKKLKNQIIQFVEKFYKNKYYLREVLINQSILQSQRKNFSQSNESLNKVIQLIQTEGTLEQIENQSYTDYALCYAQLDFNQSQSKGYTKEELIERINLYQQFLDHSDRIVDENLITILKNNLSYLGKKLFAANDSTKKEEFDQSKIKQILKEFPDLIQLIKNQQQIDELLTDFTIFKTISKKPLQQQQQQQQAAVAPKPKQQMPPTTKQIKKKRKRQIRLPKNYDPNNPKSNLPLDPDRWKNRFQKHNMKFKKNKQNQFRGPQGMVDEKIQNATQTSGPAASTIQKEVSSNKARKDKKRKKR